MGRSRRHPAAVALTEAARATRAPRRVRRYSGWRPSSGAGNVYTAPSCASSTGCP